jgi:hypothetical protein
VDKLVAQTFKIEMHMVYMKIFFIFLAMILVGCESGPTGARRIHAGQWTIPQSIGGNSFLIEGYDTQDALSGGRSHCAGFGKQFILIQLTPHTSRLRATLTFRCD